MPIVRYGPDATGSSIAVKGEDMATTSSGGLDRGGEQSALLTLMDGLIERVQRMPLMRRAPAQCTPEEQAALAQVLVDLAALRRARVTLEALPSVRHDQVTAYWPELGAVLGPVRRSGARGGARSRDAAVEQEPAALFDVPPPEPAPGEQTPAGDGEPVAEVQQAQTELTPLLTEALAGQGRALNTTQILSWLEERGVKATREQITDTLFRHEELFRKRGTSQWVAATRE